MALAHPRAARRLASTMVVAALGGWSGPIAGGTASIRH